MKCHTFPVDILVLEIEGGEKPESAGTNIQLKCRAWGSNPPAQITWWRGGTPMENSVTAVSIE